MTAAATNPRDRIMARLDLTRFDIAMDVAEFREILADVYHTHYRAWTNPDELVVRPREAIKYADWVRDAMFARGEENAYDVPDDTILRTLLNMRKNN